MIIILMITTYVQPMHFCNFKFLHKYLQSINRVIQINIQINIIVLD